MALGGCVVWARRSAQGWSACSEGAGRAFQTRRELIRRPHGSFRVREQQLLKGGLGCGVGGWRSRSKAILGEPTWLSAGQSDAYARGVGTGRVLPKVC